MAKANLIWVGPGVLNPTERGKDKKPLMPGDSIPDGFVSRDRVEGLKKKGKIVSQSAYAKGQAAAGVKPGEDTGKVAELTSANKELTQANKELQAKIEDLGDTTELTAANEELTKANGELTAANEELTKANKELAKKGDK